MVNVLKKFRKIIGEIPGGTLQEIHLKSNFEKLSIETPGNARRVPAKLCGTNPERKPVRNPGNLPREIPGETSAEIFELQK